MTMPQPAIASTRAVVMGVLLALAGCGTQTPAGMWTLDTSAWPDCGWSDATMVYTNTAEVRRHDLATGADVTVWSRAKLAEISGLSSPGPSWISLSADRRWMAVSLSPLTSSSSQQLALSCDGSTWERIGPDDARFVGAGRLAPDDHHLALGHWGSPHAPEGFLVLDLRDGTFEKLGDSGGAMAWSPDSTRLVYRWYDSEDSLHLGVATIQGDAPEIREQRVLYTSSCAWDGHPDYVYCDDGSDVVKRFFDETKPLEPVGDIGLSFLRYRPADGKLYGLFGEADLWVLDLTTGKTEQIWPKELSAIYDFSF
jgi:hypothetical protein